MCLEYHRAVGTHIKQYQTAIRRGEIDKYVIAEHTWAEQHHPIQDEASVIEKAKNVDILQIEKTFCIALVEKHSS